MKRPSPVAVVATTWIVLIACSIFSLAAPPLMRSESNAPVVAEQASASASNPDKTGTNLRPAREISSTSVAYHQGTGQSAGSGPGMRQGPRSGGLMGSSGSQTSSSSPPANVNRCQSGWMWYNNKCWVTTESRRDFTHAIDFCKKKYNSTLPTIHSEDENEFLRQNIDLHNSPIWLYARHNHQYNKTRWLDKTSVNYTRWDNGQPSDKSSLVCIKTDENWYMKKAEAVDGQTECVSFWEDAKWGTQVGCLVLLPVVCEKKLTPVTRSSENGTLSPEVGYISDASSHYGSANGPLTIVSLALTLSWLTSMISSFSILQHHTSHNAPQRPRYLQCQQGGHLFR